MPLKQMSYDTADNIINLYSKLLMDQDKLKGLEKYGYSAMKGYDIVDVSNAINLMVAYKFFNEGRDNKERINDIKEYIFKAGGAISVYSFNFFPDEVAHDLRQIDTSNLKESTLERIRVTQGEEYYEWNELIKAKETPNSFFSYCEFIGNKDPDFWEKVYSRLGIAWESNNSEDKIYFIIKYKDYFFDRKKDNKNAQIENQNISVENNATSIFTSLKNKLLNLIKP